MGGYAGRALYIDLTKATCRTRAVAEDWKRKYIGGRGFGVRVISDLLDPQTAPLSKENIIVVTAGPLTGSRVPMGSRFDVVTKSPLTGTLSSANSGGFFGTALKRAGYDMLVIQGKAKNPVYLSIGISGGEIRDGRAIWGMTTRETIRALQKSSTGETARVACIGPAGENLSLMAAIINDAGRAAARGGVGAVMGSKHLKAIAVSDPGQGAFRMSDPYSATIQDIRKRLQESGMTAGGLHTHGTAALMHLVHSTGVLPAHNHQVNVFEGIEEVSGEELTAKYLKSRSACYSCPVACGRVCTIDGQIVDGPEYETIWAFGPECGVKELSWIIRANHLCNELGLDTISTGVTIACAMELSQRGYCPNTISFGDGEVVFELVKKIASREGIGDEMAEGSYRFASRYGHPELSMSVKKQELPAYDPRGLQGQGLEYATSVRGGCHVYGNMVYPEVLGIPVPLNPFVREEKARWTKYMQDFTAAVDSSGMCLFITRALGPGDFADIISSVTEVEMSGSEFLTAGERIWNLQKVFNIKAGLGKDDDTLPERLMDTPLSSGAPAGETWHREPLLSQYYGERGWDSTGRPTDDTLRRLGIAP